MSCPGKNRRKPVFLCLFAALLAAALPACATAVDSPDAEIEVLIQAVQDSDCIFIRNGDRHDAGAAADHLRLKYRRGRRHANTTENFIERLASHSSWSGKPYFMECGGETIAVRRWLEDRLTELREAR